MKVTIGYVRCAKEQEYRMLSEEIRGIANCIIVGLLIDNKIVRLLYPVADEVERLEYTVKGIKDKIDRAEGERVQFGDRIVALKGELMSLKSAYYNARNKSFFLEEKNEALRIENKWMRREVERVGRALFTGTKTGDYVGTEEDLHSIGSFVEGVCENNEQLFREREALEIITLNASTISLQGKIRMIAIELEAWKRALDLRQGR